MMSELRFPLKRYVEKNYTYRYGRIFASVEERDHPELVGTSVSYCAPSK